ncbi:hypothetical protein [Sphingomicrobium nitratireducens]|uniref:hypothetical protein n=1 Tax=Sphingomicrobium nitratireducens TaxID=2964666 RepID=UPI00223F2BA9|nr:hypothetical protein [Sphingomicrobium nitratireducens]
MFKKTLPLLLVATLGIAGCNQKDEVIEVGGPADPMKDELAKAPPIDPSMVPVMVGSDDYRCSGSNALIQVDWIKTGEVLTARVTPQGEAGVTFTQGEGGGFTSETAGASLSGSPDGDTVTFNGSSCSR